MITSLNLVQAAQYMIDQGMDYSEHESLPQGQLIILDWNHDRIEAWVVDSNDTCDMSQMIKLRHLLTADIPYDTLENPAMTLTQIILAGAKYAGDVSIDVDTSYGTVAIGDDIFLQGDEAYAFIDEAQELWDKSGDVSIDDVYAHLAGPYLDCLG